jgi:hypothetical protein
MKPRDVPFQFWLLPAVLIILVVCSVVSSPAQVPSIEGTYQLVSRQLPDGTRQAPPDIMGLLTYTKAHRNFNVIWKDAQGKFFSYSLGSTYQLTSTEYRETLLFSILNDQIGGKEIVYELSGKTQSVPVKIDGGRLQFKLPFDPPSVVFEGAKMTATAEGRFVDVWEKVP